MNVSLRLLPILCLALPGLPAHAQQAYPTPDAAAEALVAALGTTQADKAQLATVFGADWAKYIPLDNVDREDTDAFLARYRERHAFEKVDATRVKLTVGNEAWVLPVPLVKGGGGWAFDLAGAGPELAARRIGRNELDAVQASLAYVDAQDEYAGQDRDGDGVLEYAQKFVSSDGSQDGLFWEAAEGEPQSPLGPLFGDDTAGGVWHGYHYRILSAQGASAPRGAYDYKLGDNMSRGFALVAWPARYADSGVMSFIVSHDGEVFEKDLGPDGDKVARAMTLFDPDSSWEEVVDASTAAASH